MKETKIPRNRIICSAMAFSFLTGNRKHECEEARCCYHCKKAFTTCKNHNGCQSRILKGYPKACPGYPLVWKDAITIWFYFSIFLPQKSDLSQYSTFQKAVHQFIEEKKKKI